MQCCPGGDHLTRIMSGIEFFRTLAAVVPLRVRIAMLNVEWTPRGRDCPAMVPPMLFTREVAIASLPRRAVVVIVT